MAINGISTGARRALASPTVLRGVVDDIGRLQKSRRLLTDEIRELKQQLSELKGRPDAEGAATRMTKLRAEIKAFEAQQRAVVAKLDYREEQLESIRKGETPDPVDRDPIRRAEAEQEDPRKHAASALRYRPDLSVLNERYAPATASTPAAASTPAVASPRPPVEAAVPADTAPDLDV